jgi:class 3 adenylate cyclase
VASVSRYALLITPELSEERKVVSILFVDLVGFATRSDRADPEDIRATLRPYYTCVRRELVRWGGTVEKFIGDAVMAAFGAPVAHEDDAEQVCRGDLRQAQALPEQFLPRSPRDPNPQVLVPAVAVVSLVEHARGKGHGPS